MKFAHDLLPAIIFFTILVCYIVLLYLMRTFLRIKAQHPPFTENFLRAPGQSLIKKFEILNEDISLNAILLITTPLLFYSGYVSYGYFYNREFDPIVVNILVGVGAVITIYYLTRTMRLIKKRRWVRMGYEGQMVVSQELNQLMLEGNYVYHNFPADKFNIDHIVVGRLGIFTVETNAQLKPSTKNHQQYAPVEYNGKMLIFPDREDFKIIEQAERQASWLSEWISNAIGEQVAARAVVALPGWVIKRTSADGISVVNPSQFPSLFKHIKPRPLTDEMVSRIARLLEQKCRKGEPGSQTSGKNINHSETEVNTTHWDHGKYN